jgi:hypothetical protein
MLMMNSQNWAWCYLGTSRSNGLRRGALRQAGKHRAAERCNVWLERRVAAVKRAGRSARTAEGRTGHRLSPDEVRIIIEGSHPAVYERIFERKSIKTIWMKKRRVARLRDPAFVTLRC